MELAFTVADVEAFYREKSMNGVTFSMAPKKQDFGGMLAQFVDCEGAHCSVGEAVVVDLKVAEISLRFANFGVSGLDHTPPPHAILSRRVTFFDDGSD